MPKNQNKTNPVHFLFASIVTLIATAAFSAFFIKLDLSLEGKMGEVDTSLFRAENRTELFCAALILILLAAISYGKFMGNQRKIGVLLGANIILLLFILPLAVASMHPLAIFLLLGLLMSTYIYLQIFSVLSQSNIEG